MARTIQALQAPSAKPIGISFTLTENFTSIIDAPDYDIPDVRFGGGREIVPGVIEIASPLMLVNTTDNPDIRATVKIVRDDGDESIIISSFKVPINDVLSVPVQGQFLISGDELQVSATQANAISGTLSVTEGQAEQEITE
jgi:hypothetical protein